MKNDQDSVWRRKAREVISRVLEDHAVTFPASLPIETQKELLALLRDAYPFGDKRNWPYIVWRQEVRTTFGLKPGYQSRRSGKIKKIYCRETMLPCMIPWAEKNNLFAT